MISILFGAGASFGSEKRRATPPLGDALFNALDALGGAYSKLSNIQKASFRKNGFEIGMLSIPNNSTIINPLQKELAIYLSSFSISKDNAYRQLFKTLGNKTKKLNIMSLNYDLLIEKSLSHVGDGFLRYGVFDNETSILKVHGSSNFTPATDGFMGSVSIIDCDSFVNSGGIRVLKSHEEIKEWCNLPQNQVLSPVMCMYNKEKREVINKNNLKSFKDEYNKAILASNLIIIVGVKYIPHDNHIWDNVMSSNTKLIIVDPYPSKLLLNILKERKTKATLIKKSFYDSTTELSQIIKSELKQRQNLTSN